MEKIVKHILQIIFFITMLTASAQETVIRPGLIRAMATISPSKMADYNETYFYLHGNLEGYLHKRVSVVGEGYMFLGEQSNSLHPFKFNHNLFFGFNYHFTKKNNDLYFGIQPGVSIAKLGTDTLSLKETNVGTSPVVSLVAGYNYYVGKFFHFFIQTRYIAGEHIYNRPKSLNEIRFSAGLGFNINSVKSR